MNAGNKIQSKLDNKTYSLTYCLKWPQALLNWLDKPLIECLIFSNFKKKRTSRMHCFGVRGLRSFHLSNINHLAKSMRKAVQSDCIFVKLHDSEVIPKIAISGQGEIDLPKKPEMVSKIVTQKLLSFVQNQNICAWEAGVKLKRSQAGSKCWKCLDSFSFVQCTSCTQFQDHLWFIL